MADKELKQVFQARAGERQRPRILIVDDSTETRAALIAHLAAPPLSACVEEAHNGAVGLKMCAAAEYDCVICDLEMPLMSGIDFLRAVRSQKSALELPVLLLTGANRVRRKLDGFKAGASDFVTKPWVPEELTARVMTQVNLATLNRQITRLADEDPLTGLANRRTFMRVTAAECSRAHRYSHTVGLILIDIDHFKRVNDEHGHPVGDAVILSLARILADSHRIYDGVARLGGEEFAVLIPQANAEQAASIAERLRSRVAESSLGDLPVGAVSISLGVAIGGPGHLDPNKLYKRADDQLYRAKREGRNRVCLDSGVERTT